MKKPKQSKSKNAGKARKAPKSATVAVAPKETRTRARDPRLPAAGTVLTRPYKGKDYRVTVLDEGFRYDGREFRSLSKLASEITGAKSINGFLWMRLTGATADAPKPKAAKSKRKSAAQPESAPAAVPVADAPAV